jgi:hypothetical protein
MSGINFCQVPVSLNVVELVIHCHELALTFNLNCHLQEQVCLVEVLSQQSDQIMNPENM